MPRPRPRGSWEGLLRRRPGSLRTPEITPQASLRWAGGNLHSGRHQQTTNSVSECLKRDTFAQSCSPTADLGHHCLTAQPPASRPHPAAASPAATLQSAPGLLRRPVPGLWAPESSHTGRKAGVDASTSGPPGWGLQAGPPGTAGEHRRALAIWSQICFLTRPQSAHLLIGTTAPTHWRTCSIKCPMLGATVPRQKHTFRVSEAGMGRGGDGKGPFCS